MNWLCMTSLCFLVFNTYCQSLLGWPSRADSGKESRRLPNRMDVWRDESGSAVCPELMSVNVWILSGRPVTRDEFKAYNISFNPFLDFFFRFSFFFSLNRDESYKSITVNESCYWTVFVLWIPLGLVSPLLLDRSFLPNPEQSKCYSCFVSRNASIHVLCPYLCPVQRSWWLRPGPLTPFIFFQPYLGPSNPPLPSLVLPVRPQQPAAMLILLWVAAAIPRSRSISHWLRVRSVRPGWLGELDPDPPGCFEEMVRKMWLRLRRKSPPAAPRAKLPLRRTMRVLADLAGRDLWLYSSWDRWDA